MKILIKVNICILSLFIYNASLNAQSPAKGKGKIEIIDSFFHSSIEKYLVLDSHKIKDGIVNGRNHFHTLARFVSPESEIARIDKNAKTFSTMLKDSMDQLNGMTVIDYAILNNSADKIKNGKLLYVFDIKMKLKHEIKNKIYYSNLLIWTFGDTIWETFLGGLLEQDHDSDVQFQYAKEHYSDYLRKEPIKE